MEINKNIKTLRSVIKKFKGRSNVCNGIDIGWNPNGNDDKYLSSINRPKNIGSGLTTTGWCVSASESLLNDVGFQSYLQLTGGWAKLISIDVKEQYHGYCYNGSQNKWHTAILLILTIDEKVINYVVDLTCGQFGNDFINKDVWSIEAWMQKFRSALCSHEITDKLNNPINYKPVNVNNLHKDIHDTLKSKYNLNDFTTLDSTERDILINFMDNINEFNNKLILGTIKKSEINLMNKFVEIYQEKMFQEYQIPTGYSRMIFNNKEAANNWIESVTKYKETFLDLVDFQINQNLLVFESIEDATKNMGYIPEIDDKYILNVEFNNIKAFKSFTKIKSYIIFIGTHLQFEVDEKSFQKLNKNETTIKFYGEELE